MLKHITTCIMLIYPFQVFDFDFEIYLLRFSLCRDYENLEMYFTLSEQYHCYF